MIDPLISLAINMEDAKGTYALLIGSGGSRSAGIPTGYEVTLDLIERVAELSGEDTNGDPGQWWQDKYESEPDYSKVIEAVAAGQGDRQRLLSSYFEPTDAERENGTKVPMPGHKAIAELVAGGWVRLIITTNFDRLIEQAIQDVGIAPDVISSIDQIGHVTPLIHSNVTIVKVHGDYRDVRILNTADELDTYPDKLDTYLRSILEDHGLIVAGWSGDWDPALAIAVAETHPTYGTYWAHRGRLSERAQAVVEARNTHTIQITDADTFFQDVLRLVQSAADVAKPDPRSVELTIAAIKRFLPRPEHRIELEELIETETQKIVSAHAALPRGGPETDGYLELLDVYVKMTRPLCDVLNATARWCTPDQAHLVTQAVNRLLNHPHREGGRPEPDLERLPALLVAYTAALGARRRGDRVALYRYLNGSRMSTPPLQDEPGVNALSPASIVRGEILHSFYTSTEKKNYKNPVAHWVREQMQSITASMVPADEFEATLDDVEYLHALLEEDNTGRFNPGEFGYRMIRWDGETWDRPNAASRFDTEIAESGANHPLLVAGAFNGSLDQLMNVRTRVHDWIAKYSS